MCLNITENQISEIMGRVHRTESMLGDLADLMFVTMYDEDAEADGMDDIADAMGASSWDFGMSKLVLFFDEYNDIVVKIPLSGCIVYEYDGDEESDFDNGEWEEVGRFVYHEAYSDTDEKWDYCHTEELMYNKAVSMNVEKAFSQTMCIGHSESGYPVYVSEKIREHTSKMTRYKRDRFIRYINDTKMQTFGLGSYVASDLLASYPIMTAIDVIKFMHENCIDGDIHSGNYRYDDDGNIVFIDYSNFNDHTDYF